MSNDGSTESSKQHHSGGGDVPIILTTQQREEAEEKRERKAEVEAARMHRENDEAYKGRQLTLTEAANRLSRRNLVFTSILALFTIIGAVAAIWQGIIAARNAHSAEIAAHAAQSAAVTANGTLNEMKADAQKTLDANKEALNLDQRPWVGLSEPSVESVGDHLEQKGVATNSGKTPARDVRIVVGTYGHYGTVPTDYYTPNEEDYRWMAFILKKAWNKEIKPRGGVFLKLTPEQYARLKRS
jgi:hypothetical protein